jgi:hypothetical protein
VNGSRDVFAPVDQCREILGGHGVAYYNDVAPSVDYERARLARRSSPLQGLRLSSMRTNTIAQFTAAPRQLAFVISERLDPRLVRILQAKFFAGSVGR